MYKPKHFLNRTDAGKQLAQALKEYKGQEAVVYALPRGGVTVAVEIAKFLKAPLDLVIARKIGHPYQPEYAIAAIAEDGHMIGNPHELDSVDKKWLEKEKEFQRQEAKRRREAYLQGRKEPSVKDKVAILVDDGIATGLTMQVAIMELKHRQPKKLVVAVPCSPRDTANLIKSKIDDFIALDVPPPGSYFLGAVGAYYAQFPQVEDKEVIDILKEYSTQDQFKAEK